LSRRRMLHSIGSARTASLASRVGASQRHAVVSMS
jgi:hypothetical protein